VAGGRDRFGAVRRQVVEWGGCYVGVEDAGGWGVQVRQKRSSDDGTMAHVDVEFVGEGGGGRR